MPARSAFTREERRRIVREAQSAGVRVTAAAYGVSKATIYNWMDEIGARRVGGPHLPRYTAEQKRVALQVYAESGAEVAARAVGAPESTVRKWAYRAGVPAPRRQSEHGALARYEGGCRCVQCRKANADHARRQKAARAAKLRRGEIERPHGHPDTYGNYDCRCEPCRDAHSRAMAYYKAQRQAERQSA